MTDPTFAEPQPDWHARLQAVEHAADAAARRAALLAAVGEVGHDADRAADLVRAADNHGRLSR